MEYHYVARKMPVRRDKTKPQTALVTSCSFQTFSRVPKSIVIVSVHSKTFRIKSTSHRFLNFKAIKKIDYKNFESTVQISESIHFYLLFGGKCSRFWDHFPPNCGTGSFSGLNLLSTTLLNAIVLKRM